MSAWRTTAALGVLLLCLSLGGSARAEPEKRAVPDYDGRVDPPTDAGDVLIWVPRIVLSPLYLVSEYVLRRPIGFLVTEAERLDLFGTLGDAFTFGGGSIGVIPTAFIDFGTEAGFLPSFGAYVFWDGFLSPDNDIRLRAAYGGSDWIQLDLKDTIHLGERTRLAILGLYERRKDWIFAGIGGDVPDDRVSRYSQRELFAGLRLEHTLGRRGFVQTRGGIQRVTFFRQTCCGDPGIADRRAAGEYPRLEDGYDTGYLVYAHEVTLALDTRATRPSDETGVRAELRGRLGVDVDGGTPNFGWVGYGATLGGFVDIWQHRTLGLLLAADFVDPITPPPEGGQVPFTELTALGGDEPFTGFIEGRLRDRSALTLTLDYRWPIWIWLDGWLYASVGNVFDAHLSDFAPEKMRMSFGVGMRPGDHEDHEFRFLLAFGTEPFEDGAGITSFRIAIGTTSGF